MNIRVIKFENLTSDEIAAWSDIQRSERSLDSPYFRPEFTQAVAAVRNDVEVAVLEEAGLPVGFLPFQRSSWNAGRPVGGALSDFHGIIARSGTYCDPLELLRACGLSTWHFSHLVAGQTWLAPYVRKEANSPYVDLSDGMDAYLASRVSGRRFMARYGQKKRKLAREVGPVRCDFHQPDAKTLDTCIRWKREQYWRTNELDIFGFSWVRNLLARMLQCVSEDFSAVVGVLRAGDTIAALHFGMRSRSVFHSWFPVYNVELAIYSPGFLQWVELMQSAQAHGIRRIDLSTGQEAFKRRFQSGAARVAEGTVDAQLSTALFRLAYQSARDRLRNSPLGVPARTPARFVRRITHWLEVR
jgi:CelD/BcsL family acetyltransferase involved in cellulose biosynthesis